MKKFRLIVLFGILSFQVNLFCDDVCLDDMKFDDTSSELFKSNDYNEEIGFVQKVSNKAIGGLWWVLNRHETLRNKFFESIVRYEDNKYEKFKDQANKVGLINKLKLVGGVSKDLIVDMKKSVLSYIKTAYSSKNKDEKASLNKKNKTTKEIMSIGFTIGKILKDFVEEIPKKENINAYIDFVLIPVSIAISYKYGRGALESLFDEVVEPDAKQ